MRKNWNQYFIDIAFQVATRATCDRKHVGAVIVSSERSTILSTGYNGSMKKMNHCDEVGHLMEDGHCVRTIHAEQNAIIQAARSGTAIDGAMIYVTCMPCWLCFKMIVNSGIEKIFYSESYRDDPKIIQACQELNIHLEKVEHVV